MKTFFIIDPETTASTDWSPTPYLGLAPVLIRKGEHEGSYAIDTYCFQSASEYEVYRPLLETFPTADLEKNEDWFPEIEPEDPEDPE